MPSDNSERKIESKGERKRESKSEDCGTMLRLKYLLAIMLSFYLSGAGLLALRHHHNLKISIY